MSELPPAIDANIPCDLCSLPVGVAPLILKVPERTVVFCCEGCKGIYQMLHDIADPREGA
jgi:hypothetical protein